MFNWCLNNLIIKESINEVTCIQPILCPSLNTTSSIDVPSVNVLIIPSLLYMTRCGTHLDSTMERPYLSLQCSYSRPNYSSIISSFYICHKRLPVCNLNLDHGHLAETQRNLKILKLDNIFPLCSSYFDSLLDYIIILRSVHGSLTQDLERPSDNTASSTNYAK